MLINVRDLNYMPVLQYSVKRVSQAHNDTARTAILMAMQYENKVQIGKVIAWPVYHEAHDELLKVAMSILGTAVSVIKYGTSKQIKEALLLNAQNAIDKYNSLADGG